MPDIIHDPAELYRVDIITGETQTGTVYFNATDDEVTTTARGIIVAQGGDHGDVYQHNGAGGGSYYETVGVE